LYLESEEALNNIFEVQNRKNGNYSYPQHRIGEKEELLFEIRDKKLKNKIKITEVLKWQT